MPYERAEYSSSLQSFWPRARRGSLHQRNHDQPRLSLVSSAAHIMYTRAEPSRTAVLYMIHDPVLSSNFWALRTLAQSVPPERLFALYDGTHGQLTKRLNDLLENKQTLPLPREHFVACHWRTETLKLNGDLSASVSRHAGFHGRKHGVSHVLYEPRLACWADRFGDPFTHVWHIEKDAILNGDATRLPELALALSSHQRLSFRLLNPSMAMAPQATPLVASSTNWLPMGVIW